MMRNKVLIIFLLFISADVFMACCRCDFSKVGVFYHKSIGLQHLDNSGAQPVLVSTDTLNKNAYGLRVKFTRDLVAKASNTFSLMSSSAYAMKCDCANDYITSGDTVSQIQCFTLYDFDANHPANSDISDYWRELSYEKLLDLDKLKRSLNEMFKNEQDLSKSVDILLMHAPTIGVSHQFKIVLTLSNGKTIEQTSTPIYLL
jgi:hypothetical protein